jgi:flagellar motor switch protein FliN/FliY
MTDAVPQTNSDQVQEPSPVEEKPPVRNTTGVEASTESIVSNYSIPQASNIGPDSANIDMLMDVTLQVAVELGRTRLTVKQVLDLQNGSVVELDRLAGDVVDIYINDHLLARGEVVVVDDKFGVRITELIAPKFDGGDN